MAIAEAADNPREEGAADVATSEVEVTVLKVQAVVIAVKAPKVPGVMVVVASRKALEDTDLVAAPTQAIEVEVEVVLPTMRLSLGR